MKTVDGVNYLSISEVAKIVERSNQTLKNWYKWCASEDINIEDAGLPEYRRDLDGKNTYYFKESDVQQLIDFRENISYGKLSDFNVSRWGQRGKEIEARKTEHEQAATALEA